MSGDQQPIAESGICDKPGEISELWISQDHWSVVSYRGQIAHQLQRDVSSFPGLTDVYERQEGDSCQVQGRQQHNNVLYQSHTPHR